MWNLLLSWAVVAVLAPLAFTAGVSVLSMTPPEFRTARRWFWVSALLVLAGTGAWVAGGLAERWLLGVVVSVAVGIGLAFTLRWVNRKQLRETAPRVGNAEVLAAIVGRKREELAADASTLADGIEQLVTEDIAERQKSGEPGPPTNVIPFRAIRQERLVARYRAQYQLRVHKLLGECDARGFFADSRVRDANNDPHDSGTLYTVVNGLRALATTLRA